MTKEIFGSTRTLYVYANTMQNKVQLKGTVAFYFTTSRQ